MIVCTAVLAIQFWAGLFSFGTYCLQVLLPAVCILYDLFLSAVFFHATEDRIVLYSELRCILALARSGNVNVADAITREIPCQVVRLGEFGEHEVHHALAAVSLRWARVCYFTFGMAYVRIVIAFLLS